MLQVTGQKGSWYSRSRCSVCTCDIWSYPITLKEPVEAPEPRREWFLCTLCHEALLVELRRSSLRSPTRLRIALGLVAAERSPAAHISHVDGREQQAFQREFVWGIYFLVFFALLHLVIFAIIFAVPR